MLPAQIVTAKENEQLLSPCSYRLYGLTVGSHFKFTHNVTTTLGKPDLVFECVDSPPISLNWQDIMPSFPTSDSSDLNIYFYAQPGFDILKIPGTGDFYIWPEKIVCHREPAASDAWLEIQFLGSVLSFWLERQSIPALHASAVVLSEGGEKTAAVGFLATSQGGKSSLAAAMVQLGCPLLTDDILPVKYQSGKILGLPGYAQMRLWPDQATHFLGSYHDLVPVYPEITKRRVPIGPDSWGQFCDTPQPLGCLYLPERRDPSGPKGTDVEIIPISPRDAVIELVRESFAAPILHAMGILPQRLKTLTDIVQQVPVRRLIYPNGVSYLPQVCEAIQAESARGESARGESARGESARGFSA